MSRVDDFIAGHWDSMSASEREHYLNMRTLRDVVKLLGAFLVVLVVCCMALWPSCSESDDQLEIEQVRSHSYQKREALRHCLGNCNEGYSMGNKYTDKDKTANCAQMCADAVDKVMKEPQKKQQ